MKIRIGFVSNSSSSSFVLDKSEMTEAQINHFREVIHEAESKDGTGDTDIFETSKHFYGDYSISFQDIPDFLKENNLEVDR